MLYSGYLRSPRSRLRDPILLTLGLVSNNQSRIINVLGHYLDKFELINLSKHPRFYLSKCV